MKRRNISLTHFSNDRISIPASKSDTKLSGLLTSQRNSIQPSSPQLTPSTQIELLSKNFPDFPKKMLRCLILRSEGRYSSVYNDLKSKGWRPRIKKETSKLLSKTRDKHLTTPYYHGVVVNEVEIEKISKKCKKTGSFCTFAYSKPGKDTVYYLCINDNDTITMKAIDGPAIDKNLVKQFKPVRDKETKDLSYIPSFSSTSLWPQYNSPMVSRKATQKHRPAAAVPACL